MIIIKYKCTSCSNTFTFYNRCSFLLHARKHFSMTEGSINLANVDISLLPVELAGFARHESVPFLFDDEEEYANNNNYINIQFYSPEESEAGKPIVTLKPYNLVFHYSEDGNNILLVLKQISTNIPLCEFVTQEVRNVPVVHSSPSEPEIKQEILENEEFTLPVISKIESVSDNQTHRDNREYANKEKCPECLEIQSLPLAAHFLGKNKPLDESLCCYVCKYIAPTKCSLQAHIRTHQNVEPYVCPDCGKQFSTSTVFQAHLEDVCFHVSKHVRFRCPAYKCGKLFVMRNTYSSHFTNHFQIMYQCSACNISFVSEADFTFHSRSHDSCSALKIFNCTVCVSVPNLTEDKFPEHINWHLQAREGYVYIYTCKFCRSYFRSSTTYFVHKQRCAKSDRTTLPISTCCHFCGMKFTYREKDTVKVCSFCKQINNLSKIEERGEEEKNNRFCMLCKEEIPKEKRTEHEKVCKYYNPIVTIQPFNNENKETSDETSSSEKLSDVESKQSNVDTSNDSFRENVTNKKKRKRPNVTIKIKKFAILPDDCIDLQAETPVSFDGIYYCKLCDYTNTDRKMFHGHIVEHRNVSTSYQCMECGECFVVKPSLIKHLTHYHKIEDTAAYLSVNDCYDKDAVEKLESNLRLVPGEHRGPVQENQCRVCLEQFDSALELSKHFRIHGMAFLMKKSK